MKQFELYSKLGWEWTKFVLQTIWNHLPMISLYLVVGFVIGVALAFLYYRVAKRKGVFARPRPINFWYKAWLVVTRSLAITSILLLVMTGALYLGTQKAMKMEVGHGVDVGVEMLAHTLFQQEDSRASLELSYDILHKAGEFLNQGNEVMAEMLAQEVMKSDSWESTLFKFLGTSAFEREVVETMQSFEEQTILFLINFGLEQIGSPEIIGEETFHEAFVAWLDGGYHDTMPDVKDWVMNMVWQYIGPALFSVFIPWFVLLTGIALIPFLDQLVYRKWFMKTD